MAMPLADFIHQHPDHSVVNKSIPSGKCKAQEAVGSYLNKGIKISVLVPSNQKPQQLACQVTRRKLSDVVMSGYVAPVGISVVISVGN